MITEQARPRDEILPSLVLHRFISGYWISGALYIVAKLGIADLLKEGPRSIEELAASSGSDAVALHRIMRALSSVRIFSDVGDRRYGLAPMSEFLLSDVQGSLRAWTILQGEEWRWKVWGHALGAVETGRTAFDDVYGMPFFEYLDRHPDAADVYYAALVGLDPVSTSNIMGAYDFSVFDTIVDVGGGLGALMKQLLDAFPRLRGVLFDLPGVIERATLDVQHAGLENRCTLVAGNFLESVPSGGDLYILKQVIHLLTDESAPVLLRNCRRAMGPGARLLIIEQVLSAERSASYGKLLDLDMMVVLGGCLRTLAEHERLLSAAGLRLLRSVTLPESCAYSVLEVVCA